MDDEEATPEAEEPKPQKMSVRIICGWCGNRNRTARRACKRCNHTGFEGVREITGKPGEPISLGGIMPDPAKLAPPPDTARSLRLLRP